MIPVYCVTDNFSFEQLAKLPRTRLEHGWNISPKTQIEFALAISSKALLFSARTNQTLTCRRDLKPGDFVEGLWEQDVFELFIGKKNSTCYQEFNFSPAGAWWTAQFDSPRTRSVAQAAPGEIQVIIDRTTCAFAIPNISFSAQTTLNVTAIIDQNPRQYLSFAQLSGSTPDFHQPQFFPIVQPHFISG